jgi:hypothetical protein
MKYSRPSNVKPDKPGMVDFGNWHQYIIRYWMRYLSPSEFMLLMFIVDRTFGWQKFSEVITRKHMLKGIASGGTAYHLGTSLGASTLDTTLNSLEEKGVISRHALMRGTVKYVEFTINMDWEPGELPSRRRRSRRPRHPHRREPTLVNGFGHPENGDDHS